MRQTRGNRWEVRLCTKRQKIKVWKKYRKIIKKSEAEERDRRRD